LLKWISLFILVQVMLYGQAPVTKDYQQGERLSREYGLPMALVFTESDFSIDTDALRHELVFVWVDFSEQSFQLKSRFQVTHFPTIILLDAKKI